MAVSVADTPDLLPPLDPSNEAATTQESQSNTSSAAKDETSSSTNAAENPQTYQSHETTATHTEHVFRVWSKPPNLTTEADEERLYLQGDFGPEAEKVNAQMISRRRKPQSSAKRGNKNQDSSKAARGVRERVLHFTPSWFSVTMGTGVIATLLNLLPWGEPLHSGLRWPALVWIAFDALL